MHRITLLDSLRGIAALIVVFHHYFSHFTSVFHPLQQQQPWLFQLLSFVSDLNVEAVLFFFVLSGFCIQLSIDKLDFTKRGDINYYLYKRFKRILPLYFIGLAFTLTLGLVTHQHHDSSYSVINLLGNLLFLQTSKTAGAYWFSPYGGNGPLWSLSYEMFFYLLFPWYRLFLNRIARFVKKQAALYEVGLGLALLLSLVGVLSKHLLFTPFSAFLSYFFIWFSGVYLGRLFQRNQLRDGIVSLYFGLIVSLFLTTLYFPSDTIRNLISGGCIFLSCYAFYRFTALRDNAVFVFLKSAAGKTFHFVGVGSYALYILHFPVLKYFKEDYALWACLAIVLLVPICVFLEEKLVRLKYSFLKVNYIPSRIVGIKK